MRSIADSETNKVIFRLRLVMPAAESKSKNPAGGGVCEVDLFEPGGRQASGSRMNACKHRHGLTLELLLSSACAVHSANLVRRSVQRQVDIEPAGAAAIGLLQCEKLWNGPHAAGAGPANLTLFNVWEKLRRRVASRRRRELSC